MTLTASSSPDSKTDSEFEGFQPKKSLQVDRGSTSDPNVSIKHFNSVA